MLKKSISLLLCAVFAFSVCLFALPQATRAYSPEVLVGGTDITAGDYWLNDGKGGITNIGASEDNYNVHYAFETKTLTLKDAAIAKTYSVPTKVATVRPFAAIIARVNSGLTITLEGTNSATGMDVTGTDPSAGIYVFSGGLTINGTGTLTANGGAASGTSYGIYAQGNININAATVSANSGTATSFSCGICAGGGIYMNAATVTANSGAVNIDGVIKTSVSSIGLQSYKIFCVTNTTLTVNSAAATGENGSSKGINMNGYDTLSISGGTVTVNSGSAASSYGIYSSEAIGSLISISNDANVTIDCSDAKAEEAIWSEFRLQINDYTNWYAITDSVNDAIPSYNLNDLNDFILEYGWCKYFKIVPATPSAAIESVTVNGAAGAALTPQSANITLTNNAFNELAEGTDVSTWFTNMPSGLAAKIGSYVATDTNTADVTFSGTPATTSNAAIAVTIPASAIASGHQLTAATNTNAKWAIFSTTIGNVTVSGTVGKALATQNTTITLSNDTFMQLPSNTDVSDWFKNIPGLIATIVSPVSYGSDKLTIAFSGTPTTASTEPLTVTIPGIVLNKGLDVTVGPNTNAKWNISMPSSGSSSGSSGGSSTVTVYNALSASGVSIKLSGAGLSSSDQLIAGRNPSGSAYTALLKLANGADVFNTYNISLSSGIKSTGSAMYLTFDLDSKYAGQAFTLVHQKADGSYEYFYATADYFGDLTFGPLYELSPFMLVKGTLAQAAYANLTDMPKTGDSTQPALATCAALLMASTLLAALAPCKRRW